MFENLFFDFWQINIEGTEERESKMQKKDIIPGYSIGKHTVNMGIDILSKIKNMINHSK